LLMQEPQVFIEVSALTKSYGRERTPALNGVDLSVAPGEVFGLIGPNGAGKSTLLGCLLGLLKPDAGTVTVAGKPADLMSVRRITGYVPERPDFEHWMTGRQFVEYHHMLSGLPAGNRANDVAGALSRVELAEGVWDRRLGGYSRGMLQRLNFAQMLIGKPRLLLLDEPTLGLDPTGLKVVRGIVREMRGEGVTAIINSHQLDEVERECDRVAFMRHGRIEQVENLRGGDAGAYVLFLRFAGSGRNGSTAADLSALARASGVELKESEGAWARFAVADREHAARLIKQAIESGFAVEEAVAERPRLESLFEGRLGERE